MGLDLPEYLPVAVVAALKAKGTTEAAEADRMRWVYGHLAILEECGGTFMFDVRSCRAFHGTAPESAVAVYMEVLMDGLAAGERWIEKMVKSMLKEPPPYVDTRPSQSDNTQASPPDTRPRPSSMCGRHLFFGGSRLMLSDKKLVATPATMRKLDLPISQGELYQGRVNLAELRNPPDGKKLRDVVWCQEASKARPVEAKGPSESLPSETGVLETQMGMMAEGRPMELTGPFESLPSEAGVLVESPPAEAIAPPMHSRASEAGIQAKDKVMVKVTSKACHRMLLLPGEGLLWNHDLYHHSPEFVRRVLGLVSGSLHAIYKVGGLNNGLVQLMPDLQADGYLPLRPQR